MLWILVIDFIGYQCLKMAMKIKDVENAKKKQALILNS